MRWDRLKEVREIRGLTQEELAKRVGISDQQIYRYEKGSNLPNSHVLKQISLVLEVSADYLLGLSDNPVDHYREIELSTDERQIINDVRAGRIQSLLEKALKTMDR